MPGRRRGGRSRDRARRQHPRGRDAQSSPPSPSEPCPCRPRVARAAAPTFQLQAFPDDKQVHLTWQQPGREQPSPSMTGPLRTVASSRVDTASGSDYVVKGLTNGTTYCFVIVRGQLPYVVSNVASAIPVAGPGAPTGLTANPGNSRVTLSWAAPASDGGRGQRLQHLRGDHGCENRNPVNGSPVTATSYTVPSLTNGTTYYFGVIAVNAAGQGPLSARRRPRCCVSCRLRPRRVPPRRAPTAARRSAHRPGDRPQVTPKVHPPTPRLMVLVISYKMTSAASQPRR